jgi:Holliday junction resolvase RusA-like endonuclease
MGVVKLTRLPLPVSKNARHQIIQCGRFFKNVRSKKCRLKEETIIAEIWRQLGGVITAPIFTRPCVISWTMVAPDKRPRDRQNYMESLADCLQAARVVSDDKLLVSEHSELMPYTERPGWVDVEISEIP